MRKVQTDVAIIGAGTAGMVAYKSATREGRSALLIEAGAYGTTCALEGCMPSKLLIAAADQARRQRTGGQFGIHSEGVRIDGAEVMARVRRERDRFVGFTLDEIDGIPDLDRLQGAARFASPTRLAVGAEIEVEAGAYVIATGSRPWVPPELQALGERLLVSKHIFDWVELPRSLILIGTGVIGLELGQALAELGVQVTFVARSSAFGPFSDPDLVAMAQTVFSEKLNVVLEAKIIGASIDQEEAHLQVETPGGPLALSAQYVLAATGRRPNVAGLMLENSGLLLDRRGIPVHDPFTLQCGASNIFIAGDVTGLLALQHEAADEGRTAGRNAARYPDVEPGRRRSYLSIVFSHPQMALVGQRFAQLEPGTYVSGRASFANQGRSRIMALNEGILKVYADASSGAFLGAEMLGPAAEHLGHLMAWAHQQGLTIQEMLDLPYYHPTVEEALRTALADCRKALLQRLDNAFGEPGYLV